MTMMSDEDSSFEEKYGTVSPEGPSTDGTPRTTP